MSGTTYKIVVVARYGDGSKKGSSSVNAVIPTPTTPQEPAKPSPSFRSARAGEVDPNAAWCPGYDRTEYQPLPTGTGIGTGLGNTSIIIAACGSSTAAGMAASYRGGGVSDWYLPSKDEFAAMFQARTVVGTLNDAGYWTSSQHPSFRSAAYVQHYDKGFTGIAGCCIEGGFTEYKDYDAKYKPYRMRPIRAF
jgi:hypothetical protein